MLDDKKITQKTSNEAQSENEKKTEVSQKAEPTKNIEEKASDKTKPKDAQKQKEKKPPSISHKIKRPLKSPNLAQSLLKRKLRKRKRINNLSQKSLSNHSQKMVKMNQITSQRKIGNQANLNESLEEKASQRISEIVYLKIESYGRYQSNQTLGNSQYITGNQDFAKTNKLTRYLIKLMNQCIKGNHHQAMPIQRNNFPCKPKEIHEQRETEKQETVSKKKVSESGETGPLTTQ
ncbi:Hypothetical_protein [Hexamita inflata]|uniref:Hypothetical_protein n=1 Tax=Hexamita inflata TaxID=28002 RepID=A0AA86RPH1_9EUKA|nr:Hypothetical protein HINF_LOCUS57925 [Hexamita inflata]